MNKKLSKKKSPFNQEVKNPGSQANLSAFSNPNCDPYINNENLKIPEKLKYIQSGKDEKLDTIKKSFINQNDETQKSGEIKLDTGKIEIGLDKKNKESIVSFSADDQTLKSDEKFINEDRSSEYHVHDHKKFLSNNIDFKETATDIHSDLECSNTVNLEKQFNKLSNDKHKETMIDRVVPFLGNTQEENDIKSLKNAKSKNYDKSNMQTSIEAIETLETQKEQRKMDFIQKLEQAISDTKSLKTLITDDYLLYIKKKWLMMQESLNKEKELKTIEEKFKEIQELELEIKLINENINNIDQDRLNKLEDKLKGLKAGIESISVN